MSLFSTINLIKIKKKQRNYIFLCVLFFMFSFSLCVLLLHFATYKNHLWTIIANSIITIFFGWIILILIIGKVIPNFNYIRFIERKIPLTHIRMSGVVISVEKQETVAKDIVCTPIILQGGRKIYWCDEFANCSIQQGDKLQFLLIDNFIDSYEKK
ncbi:MAG: hypothetical protein MJ179_03905 [Treponema sp.]|nr:hypothetical protein [Treponema sp.]